MSLDEHAEEGRQQLLATGITTWPEFAAAILFKFGKEFAVFVALVAVLGFCSWLLWGHQAVQAQALAGVQREYIDSLKSSSVEKAELVRAVVETQSDVAEANKNLAGAVNDLKEELRRRP